VGETTGGGFETLRGDKTQSFISRTKAYSSKNKHKKLNTRPVSFFLVFLSNLSTQNSIHLATYLYTNSKQDISTFKCEGGWRLGGCKWWLGGDSWWLQVVVAFLDLLDGLSLIQQISLLNSIEECHAKHEL
jgi:hypothetical protein